MSRKRTEADHVFARLRLVFGGSRVRSDSESKPFGKGRDPRMLGRVMDRTEHELGWDAPLEAAQLIVNWSGIVGDVIADHSHAYMEHDTVVVMCSSTAWAANLRRMQSKLLGRIHEELPNTKVTQLRFLGPDAPSWRKGIRSVPGRGPRDTYG